MLAMIGNEQAFQDILSVRIQALYNSYKYVKTHEEFKVLIDEIENKAPEFKKVIGKIDDIVVFKETESFAEGYKAGIADLMITLTFNDLQITQTQLIDCEAIDKKRQSKVGGAEA
jgi:hypothetical protein